MLVDKTKEQCIEEELLELRFVKKELLELRLRYSKLEAVAKCMTKSRDEYKAIFDTSPEAIVILNRHGIILDANGRIYDWLGYKRSEVVGNHLLELPFIHEEGRKVITDKFLKRMSGEIVPPYEIEFISKTGETLVGRIIANPIIGRLCIDNHEEIILDVVMISNITEFSET